MGKILFLSLRNSDTYIGFHPLQQDGVVNDIDDMVEALIKSCGTPLSVVIVGIGPADFSTMVSKW